MTFASDLEREPWAYDLMTVLRRAERTFPERPRIGDSSTRREDFIALGEDPYLEFAACNISRVDQDPQGRLRLFVKFLGLLGPQGPLPLSTTDEAYGWALARDDSFPRFLDVLNHRFLQLFFRAWADARPIAQHDRPAADRFQTYIGAAAGCGSEMFLNLDTIPDTGKVAFAGLLAPAAKTASRLANAASGLLRIHVEVEEFVGVFLEFDAADRSRLGGAHARLGIDLLVGASVYSCEDKIRLRVFTRDMAEYEDLLPNGARCEPLTDLVFFYIGDELDWDVELALPVEAVAPVRLGQFGRLGYTTWMTSAATAAGGDDFRRDARFHPAARLAERRRAPA